MILSDRVIYPGYTETPSVRVYCGMILPDSNSYKIFNRGLTMNNYRLMCLLSLLLLNTTAWGYGSSSSSKACEKPRFTAFMPIDGAAVAPESTFSFEVSSAVNPKSIVVTIKNIAVPVSVTPKNAGYTVQGKLPSTLKGIPARIAISAESPSKCKANEGWLVNILR
jgi:hypothetical protein